MFVLLNRIRFTCDHPIKLKKMKTLKQAIFGDTTLLLGIGSILLSLGIFLLPELIYGGNMRDTYFGIFILNYLISIVFFILFWVREIPKFKLSIFYQKMEYGFIHLILCLISAYSLNREIPVFEQSVPWLQAVLVLQGIFLLLFFVKDFFSKWFLFILWSVIGISFSLFLYLSIYLIQLYPVGLIGFPAFGISLHAFVPLWFVLTLFGYLVRKDNRKRNNIAGFVLGILVCLMGTTIFMYKWQQTSEIITRAKNKSLMDDKNDLPEWVVISQHMPKNVFSQKILKTNLVYSTAPEKERWAFFELPNKRFDEVKKHDPLILISTFFMGAPNLSSDEKIKILEAMYDSRHQAQERLWSGDFLLTNHVLTNVRLYPNLRIGYTEKIITLKNMSPKSAWPREQEAIYTFHLPEGAVVTSLSLWVNMKEEKAILTSKHKADTAYKTIVGTERRDPSLVRWQEGNTVSVRVFPCTAQEARMFKIGFTAPLRKESDKLVYDNIWFDGPSPFKADESIKINLMDEVDSLHSKLKLIEENPGTWIYQGRYTADWSAKIPAIPVRQNAFTFDGKSYRISEYSKKYIPFGAEDIYLDVNKEWTLEEYSAIRKASSSRNVYVHTNKRIKVTEQNANKLFDQLSQQNFSIFPLYEITDTQKALLITKGTLFAPNVGDLGEGEFASKLKNYVRQKGRVRMFNLGGTLTPYLKTLKELRVFEYDYGSISDLSQLLDQKKFIENQEDSGTIVVHDAGIKISETADTLATNAPDHLMRLFAYNHVMSQTGTNYLSEDFFDQAIADKAYKAYVVSPLTSLVVLETQEDYKRFGISDHGTSLKNASMKSAGAVPEPHEWMLIIVVIGVITFVYLRKRKVALLR